MPRMPTALCPACGAKPGFGRPPGISPRDNRKAHSVWWQVCACGGRAIFPARPMTYKQVVGRWNEKVGLDQPASRARRLRELERAQDHQKIVETVRRANQQAGRPTTGLD